MISFFFSLADTPHLTTPHRKNMGAVQWLSSGLYRVFWGWSDWGKQCPLSLFALKRSLPLLQGLAAITYNGKVSKEPRIATFPIRQKKKAEIGFFTLFHAPHYKKQDDGAKYHRSQIHNNYQVSFKAESRFIEALSDILFTIPYWLSNCRLMGGSGITIDLETQIWKIVNCELFHSILYLLLYLLFPLGPPERLHQNH